MRFHVLNALFWTFYSSNVSAFSTIVKMINTHIFHVNLLVHFFIFSIILPKKLNYLTSIFNLELIWWRLFQKRSVITKLDIYVSMYRLLLSQLHFLKILFSLILKHCSVTFYSYFQTRMDFLSCSVKFPYDILLWYMTI